MGLLALAAVAHVNARRFLRHVSIAGVAGVLGALAAVAALTDVHTGAHARRAVLAVDRSASIDSAMSGVEGRWISRANPDGCIVPCRVVSFGAGASSLPPSAAASSTRAATNLESGVSAAVAAAPQGGRVVVLSDGEQTVGDASHVVAAARARDVTIDAVQLTDDSLADAALTRLDAPSAVHQGDTISLLVTVRSTQIAGALLSVTRDDGKPTSQGIRLVKGDNPFTLSYTAASEGWHAFRVGVRLPGDQRRQNDVLTASVDVGAPPQAIVASVSPNPAIAQILEARGVRPIVAQPSSLPTEPEGYNTIDAVVLDDVPANLLGDAQLTALKTAVRDGGLGLVTLGGRHAYSLGGYARSALDAVLPVASLSPGDLQRRHLAVELVLDRSGSMADTAGGEGIPKMTMALSAARQTATFVSTHDDELGITAFDIAPHLVLPMERITPGPVTDGVKATINKLTADGGTDIYLGLRAGLQQVLKSASPNRHIILLTDGISQPHNYTGLLQQLKKDHIAVATVALGTDVDSALLKSISDATGGNFYATKRARDLPKIFVKETRLSAEPVQINGLQDVLPQGSSPVVRSLVGVKLPSLRGNVVTRLRAGAQVDLIARSASDKTEPALAQWGYGTGRVISWTPGLGAPWATAWTPQSALWNDAVRWVARGVPAAPASVKASVGTATALSVDLSAAGPTPATRINAVLGGSAAAGRRVALDETTPSVYTADLPVLPVGSYDLTLALPSSLGGSQLFRVDVPYAAEYQPTSVGRATLAQLATQTGGALLAPGDTAALTGDRRAWRVPLLVLALVFFLTSVTARMLVRAQFRRS
jgi:Ca-activated chloride channel family protein